MHARVGARLEIVRPQPVLFLADYGYLGALLAVAVGLHAWLISNTTVTARDSLEFVRYARNLEAGGPAGAVEYLRTANHPPGYPAAALAVSFVIRHKYPDLPPGEMMLLACQLTSAAAAGLLVLPAYRLGRGLFRSRFAGFAAVLLFQLSPTVSHLSSDGLSESLFLLLLVTALAAGVRAVRRASVLWMLVCGGIAGQSYLVRPEGLMVVVAVGAVAGVLGLSGVWPRVAAAGRLTALAVGVLTVMVPYVLVIGNLTNKPALHGLTEYLKIQKTKTDGAAVVHPALMADWYIGDQPQVTWAAKTIVKETSKAAHYGPFVVGIIGLIGFRRWLARDPGLAVVAVLGVVTVGVLFALGMRAERAYISERHTIVLVFISCLFAGGALLPLAARLKAAIGTPRRTVAAGLLLVMAGVAVPAAARPPHEQRNGFYHAGKFLQRSNLGPHDAVIDPFSWAEFYAGRSVLAIPADPIEPKVRWAVLDDKSDGHHSRLPRLQAALDVKNDGNNPPTLAYYWPEDGPPEKAKVFVWRQEVK